MQRRLKKRRRGDVPGKRSSVSSNCNVRKKSGNKEKSGKPSWLKLKYFERKKKLRKLLRPKLELPNRRLRDSPDRRS